MLDGILFGTSCGQGSGVAVVEVVLDGLVGGLPVAVLVEGGVEAAAGGGLA